MRFPPALGASLTFNVVQAPQAITQGRMALRIPAWWHAPAEGIAAAMKTPSRARQLRSSASKPGAR